MTNNLYRTWMLRLQMFLAAAETKPARRKAASGPARANA